MDAIGVNNSKNIINSYPIDKKVYYSFLNTPFDQVQVSSQNTDQKDNSGDNELKKTAGLLDPIKNYKKISKKVAGIAGAGALILGLGIVTLTRGKSGSSEAIGNILQKLRGQAYNLKTETSTTASIKYFLNTKLTGLLEGGLNTWVKMDQLKNMFLEKKIVQKLGVFKKPIETMVNWFRSAAQKRCLGKYKSAVNNAGELENLLPDLKKAVQNEHNTVPKEVINRLNDNFHLGLSENETRAEVIEKVMKKIVENTKSLADEQNFNTRQKNVDTRLDDVVKKYTDEFHIFSEGKDEGALDSLKQSATKIRTSGKEGIISRKNDIAFDETSKEVYDKKDVISKGILDNFNRNNRLLKEAEKYFIDASSSDQELKTKYVTKYFKIFRELNESMKDYKEARTFAGTLRRQDSIKRVGELTKGFAAELDKDGLASNKKFKVIADKLNETVKTFDEEHDQKGLVEELRDLMKCTDDNGVNRMKKDHGSLYTEFRKRTDKFTKSLNKAAEFETDNLFFRLMDLKLGGGNYEILGFSIPIGYGLYHASKADNHEEKVSRGIRAGSVISGGLIGWAISGVVLCLSAGPALLTGLAGGFLFDHVGEFVDDKFWSKGKNWKAINKQKKLEAKALKQQQTKTLNA